MNFDNLLYGFLEFLYRYVIVPIGVIVMAVYAVVVFVGMILLFGILIGLIPAPW